MPCFPKPFHSFPAPRFCVRVARRWFWTMLASFVTPSRALDIGYRRWESRRKQGRGREFKTQRALQMMHQFPQKHSSEWGRGRGGRQIAKHRMAPRTEKRAHEKLIIPSETITEGYAKGCEGGTNVGGRSVGWLVLVQQSPAPAFQSSNRYPPRHTLRAQ